jgi:predicted SnoaL-like aldol condensation-catalyzing enzyme
VDKKDLMSASGIPEAVSSPESNKQTVLEYVEIMWNQHDMDRALGYLTPELAEQAVPHARELFDAFSDLHVEVLQPGVIAEGDFVALRLSVGGVHDKAEFAGQPPSGNQLAWESIRIMRVEDGKIAETWAMQDRLGLMEQLGAVESRAGEVHWAAGDGPTS